jgi:hypothetical protein
VNNFASEAHLQAAVIRYIKLKYSGARYCASLGGQYQKSHKQNKKATATGYVAGVPDLQIMEARGGYFGLFLELKLNKTRRASPAQTAWLMDLNIRGYKAALVTGFDECIDTIDGYFKEKQTESSY